VQAQPIVILLDELFDIRSQMFQVVVLVGVNFFPLQCLHEAFTARVGMSVQLRRKAMLKFDVSE
jgi:hypothetical protein